MCAFQPFFLLCGPLHTNKLPHPFPSSLPHSHASHYYRGRALNASASTFNAGLLLVDLDAWRVANLTREAEWWMDQHAKSREGLWALGSQPILHLMLHGRWAALPELWNLDGLGRVPNIAPATLRTARSLHWTGRRKPWRKDGLHTAFYRSVMPDTLATRCKVAGSTLMQVP